jgi:hypothetical protein
MYKTIETETHILGFFEQNRFLSNFQLAYIEFEGLVYPSSENAYMAAKTLDIDKRNYFTTCSAKEAKQVGRTLELRDGWDNIKLSVMETILREKFSDKNKELKQKLLLTKNKYLEETNTWNDTFWGVCKGKGQNNLGKLLMKIRNEL